MHMHGSGVFFLLLFRLAGGQPGEQCQFLAEHLQDVIQALLRVGLFQQRLRQLRKKRGLSQAEVAETLDIPRRTVYSRLKRAMPAMRAALEADARPVSGAAPSREVI